MNDLLYVFRKMSAEDPVNHLIAVLRKTQDGEIEIESRLDERDLSQSYSIPILTSKIGETAEMHKARFRKWLRGFLPPPDNKALTEALMKKSGMKEYSEWEWLKRFRPDSKSVISFSDTFPECYVRHDLKLPCIDEKDHEIFFINQEFDEEECAEPDLGYIDDAFYADEYEDECFLNTELFDDDFYADEYEDEDIGTSADEFYVCDESIAPESVFDKGPSDSEQQPRISLEEFSALQDAGIVTNKMLIRKTFEAFADLPLSVYFESNKSREKNIAKLSQACGINMEESDKVIVYDVIKSIIGRIRKNDKVPKSYKDIGTIYDLMSIPLGIAITGKPLRIS